MAYCTNCGHQLSDTAKFCSNCGSSIAAKAEQENGTQFTRRKMVYEGEIHKCPGCGEVLQPFMLVCPSCGYEVRGASVVNSVHNFATQLSGATSIRQETIIRSFPIPNAKEDILEFVILASSNIESGVDNELTEAWQAKLEQAYKKSNLLFKDDPIFIKIQDIYFHTNKKITKSKQAKKIKSVGNNFSDLVPVMPNLIVITGWLVSIFILIPLCSTNLDSAGTNSYQLLLMVDLIAGVFLIPMFLKSESGLPRVLITLGLILSILVLIPQCGKSLDDAGSNAYQLILIVDIICGVLILRKMMKNKPEKAEQNVGNSLIVVIGILILIMVVYLMCGLVVRLKYN